MLEELVQNSTLVASCEFLSLNQRNAGSGLQYHTSVKTADLFAIISVNEYFDPMVTDTRNAK